MWCNCDGKRSLTPAQFRTGSALSCYQLKLENPPHSIVHLPAHVFHHWVKKPTLRISDESPWSCLVFKYLINSADGSNSWYVPKICNENDCSVFTRSILWFWNLALLASVHSLEHCKLGKEQHVYQCFSNQPAVCQFIFYFTGIQNMITCIIPAPRNRSIVPGYTLKGAVCH